RCQPGPVSVPPSVTEGTVGSLIVMSALDTEKDAVPGHADASHETPNVMLCVFAGIAIVRVVEDEQLLPEHPSIWTASASASACQLRDVLETARIHDSEEIVVPPGAVNVHRVSVPSTPFVALTDSGHPGA